jgi:protein O-GlcNAc transferase
MEPGTEGGGAEQWLDAALKAHQRGDLNSAEQLYRRVLQQNHITPDQELQASINLGALLRRQGRLKEAECHYDRSVARFPRNTTLRLNGINCLREAGLLDKALAWVTQGLKQQPHHVHLRQAEARILLGQGQGGQAEAILETLCREQPRELGLWLDLGLCRHQRGGRAEALQAFERAAQLAPQDPRAAANRITLLQELGQLEQAQQLIASLPTAVRGDADVRSAIALLWMELQHMVEAEAELAQLCRQAPQQPLPWLNRAACLRSLKCCVAATQVLKHGLRWHPEHRQLKQALGQALAELGKQQQGLRLLREAAGPVELLDDVSLVNLQFLGAGYGLIEPQELAQIAQSWERRKQQSSIGPLWPDRISSPLQDRRLRVGYFSADLCNHPVGRFLLPVLEAHNRASIELWGLHTGPHRDAVHTQLQQRCDHWFELRYGTDLEVARVIADQQLDVLVELGGYTGNSRLGVLVHRPAPVQLSYLGYYAPTYLSCVDGWLGDEELFGGLSAVDRSAHRLLLLDGGYMSYRDNDLPPLKRSTGPRFRFGSFNHARKLTPDCVRLFCKVMAAVPEAELVLKSISFVEAADRERVRDLFVHAGLEPQRLVLMPWVEGSRQHLSCYEHVDVALDPVPYGGATTSCEALAMGVPVVSLAGHGMVGRLSASILVHAGQPQWLAADAHAYVAIAAELAAQGPRSVQQRYELRRALEGSALANGQRLAAELERCYTALAAEARS